MCNHAFSFSGLRRSEIKVNKGRNLYKQKHGCHKEGNGHQCIDPCGTELLPHIIRRREEKDQDKILELNEQIVALYNVIIAGEAMSEYNAAYEAYRTLTDKISNILLMCENGEDPATCEPASCSGNCASCGGCH